MSDIKISGAEARSWARAEAEAERQAIGESSKGIGFGLVFLMLLVGVALVGLFTYLPGQIDPAYGYNGQVVNMVQPSGNNPNVDQQYSEINQGNAQANLTNARAYQRQSVVWMGWVFGLMGFGFITVVFKWIGRLLMKK